MFSAGKLEHLFFLLLPNPLVEAYFLISFWSGRLRFGLDKSGKGPIFFGINCEIFFFPIYSQSEASDVWPKRALQCTHLLECSLTPELQVWIVKGLFCVCPGR